MNGAPSRVLYTIDFHEHLIEMPPPIAERPSRLDSAAMDLGREDGAKQVPPEPYRLMRDVDSAFVQQVLDVPSR